MRTQLIAGNWKMHKSTAEAAETAERVASNLEKRDDVDVVVCPPFTSLPQVADVMRSSLVLLGAQDVFWEKQGAYTGKVSAHMLLDLGVSYCIVGHSECRGRFGKVEVDHQDLAFFADTDHTVNNKIRALLYYSINPILCVGETQEERHSGKTEQVISSQLRGALSGIDAAELYSFSVAYEPVWAIGTGNACESGEANRIAGFIRSTLASMLDADVADQIRVLYGGSVKGSNADEFLHQPEIDGALVGGASLDSDEFSRIVMASRRG